MTIKEVWNDFDCTNCRSSFRLTAATQGCGLCFPGHRITTGVRDPRIEVLCNACFGEREVWALPPRHVHRDPAMATPIDTIDIDIGDLRRNARRTYFVDKNTQEEYHCGLAIVNCDKLPPSVASWGPPVGTIGYWMTEPEFRWYLEKKHPPIDCLYCRVVQAKAGPAIAAAAAAAGLPSPSFPAGSFRGFIFQAAQEARWDVELLKHLSEILKDAYDTVQDRARQGIFKAGTARKERVAKNLNFREEVRDGFYLRLDELVFNLMIFPCTGLLDRAIMRAMDLERDTQ